MRTRRVVDSLQEQVYRRVDTNRSTFSEEIRRRMTRHYSIAIDTSTAEAIEGKFTYVSYSYSYTVIMAVYVG